MARRSRYSFCCVLALPILGFLVWHWNGYAWRRVLMPVEERGIMRPRTSFRGGCVLMSSKQILEYGRKNTYPNGIPRILHLIQRSENVNKKFMHLVKACVKLNVDMKVVFWSEYSANQLMLSDPRLRRIFLEGHPSRNETASMSLHDLKYFILHTFGGVYMDVATKCLRPFRTVMNDHKCFLTRDFEFRSIVFDESEYSLLPSLMGCIPRHHFFRKLSTGNESITQRFKGYAGPRDRYEDLHAVHIWDTDTFAPGLNIEMMIKKCEESVQEIDRLACQRFSYFLENQEFLTKKVVANVFPPMIHSWTSSTNEKREASAGDICSLTNITISRG